MGRKFTSLVSPVLKFHKRRTWTENGFDASLSGQTTRLSTLGRLSSCASCLFSLGRRAFPFSPPAAAAHSLARLPSSDSQLEPSALTFSTDSPASKFRQSWTLKMDHLEHQQPDEKSIPIAAEGRVHHGDYGAETELQRRLSTRHVTMIALGSSIGMGLWLGSGKSLASGGPVG